jgi:hypothetical protein
MGAAKVIFVLKKISVYGCMDCINYYCHRNNSRNLL